MKVISYQVITLLLLIVILSCHEKGEIKSVKDILISNSWKVSAYTINGEEIELEECQKDDFLTFASNGTYTDFRGALKCPGDVQVDINGTWTLSQDEKILTLSNFQGVLSLSVEASENTIVATFSNDGDITVFIWIPHL